MIYVTKDLTWNNGMTIPTHSDEDYVWEAGFMTSDTGTLGPSIFIWLDLIPGKYDIVSDVNDNGIYDEGVDALDDFDVNKNWVWSCYSMYILICRSLRPELS